MLKVGLTRPSSTLSVGKRRQARDNVTYSKGKKKKKGPCNSCRSWWYLFSYDFGFYLNLLPCCAVYPTLDPPTLAFTFSFRAREFCIAFFIFVFKFLHTLFPILLEIVALGSLCPSFRNEEQVLKIYIYIKNKIAAKENKEKGEFLSLFLFGYCLFYGVLYVL